MHVEETDVGVKMDASYFEFLVYVLHALNSSIHRTEFIILQFELLFEVRNFCDVCFTSCSILCFELVL